MANNLEPLKRSIETGYHRNEQGSLVYDNTPEIVAYMPPFDIEGKEQCRDCKDCAKHFRPMEEQSIDSRMYADDLSEIIVESLAHGFVKSIEQDREYLLGKLETYGNAIFSKWNKKTGEKRRGVILQASPKMFVAKDPLPHLHCMYKSFMPKRAHRETYLLPYLTVDNLCDEKAKLLSLLHNRTAYAPQDWVMFDSRQLEYGYRTGSLEVRYFPACIVMHGSKYGTLVPWNKQDTHDWSIIGWPKAHLILEAQTRLMRFLRRIVDVLMDGYQGDGGSDKWHKLTTDGFKAPGGQESWSAYCKHAFTAPPAFDPSRLLELARIRLAAGEDELWLLQTNPAYAMVQIDSIRKLKLNKAYKGHAHLWSVVLILFGTAQAPRAQAWRRVAQELSRVNDLHHKYRGAITAGNSIPQDYALAHGSLQTVVANALDQMSRLMSPWLEALPGFEHYFDVDQLGVVAKAALTEDEEGDRSMFAAYPLLWAVMRLVYQLPETDLNKEMYFSFINNFVTRNDVRDAPHMDQLLYDYLADLAAMQNVQYALDCHRPVVPALDVHTSVRLRQGPDGGESTRRADAVESPHTTRNNLLIAGRALQKFAVVRWPKGKRDKVWLEKADTSRAALMQFWDKMDTIRMDKVGYSNRFGQESEHEARLPRFDHDRDHLDEVEAERQAILTPTPERLETVVPSWSSQSALPDKPKKLKLVEEKIEKRKHSAAVHSLHESVSNDQTGTEIKTAAPILLQPIEVSTQTLGLFKSMFSSEPSEYRWQHFVAAMVEAGCSAYQNSGSAVTFKCTAGSIDVHRPHPDPIIHPIKLQSTGKRLRKRFGWDAEVFVERPK